MSSSLTVAAMSSMMMMLMHGASSSTQVHAYFVDVSNITEIAGGDAFVCALNGNLGQIKCWGDNYAGDLGLGIKTSVGDSHKTMRSLTNLDLGKNRKATHVETGLFHACATLDDNSLKCWGDNTYFQLGNELVTSIGRNASDMGDNLKPVDFGTPGVKVTQISAGGSFNCAILSTGVAKCWGSNSEGQLGLGNYTATDSLPLKVSVPSPINIGKSLKVTKIVAGNYHACAITSSKSRVKCWGSNKYGALGIGSTVANVGNYAKDMGDKLPFVNLGTGLTVQDIVIGLYFSCALFTNGKVKCWGSNDRGQLGVAGVASIGQSPSQMGNNLRFVDLGTSMPVIKLSAGDQHVCAMFSDRTLKCWGSNQYGQLGAGTVSQIPSKTGDMGVNLNFVDLGTGAHVLDFSALSASNCAVMSDHNVKCWGANEFGQLGLCHTTPIGRNKFADMGKWLRVVGDCVSTDAPSFSPSRAPTFRPKKKGNKGR